MTQTLQGDVTFRINGKFAPYRFEVMVTEEDKIILWIEDRTSKKQWTTTALEIKDFVTDENAIPKATIQLYAEKFAACLKAQGEKTKFAYAMTQKGRDCVLTITLPLVCDATTLLLEYTFVVLAVKLAPIDMLSARVRDIEEMTPGLKQQATIHAERIVSLEAENRQLKDEVQQLADQANEIGKWKNEMQQRVDALSISTRTRVAARAKTAEGHLTNHTLVWTAADDHAPSRAIAFTSTGHIEFRVAGVYSVDFGIRHHGLKEGQLMRVMHADHVVAVCTTLSPGQDGVAWFHFVFEANATDRIHAVYTATGGTALAGSSLVIVEL